MKEDQATAVIGGKVVSRLARAPLEIRSAMFGRLPPSINGSSTLKEAPSSPITSSLSLIHSIEPRYDYTLRRLLVSTSCLRALRMLRLLREPSVSDPKIGVRAKRQRSAKLALVERRF